MKISSLIVLIFLGFGSLWADAYGSFSSVVNFSATIRDLAEQPGTIDPNRLYLLDGTVSSVKVVRTDPSNFYAEVEFIRSEWQELESIQTYRVILVFSKPAFSEQIPARAPTNPSIGQIVPNSRGLALVSLIKTIPGAGGKSVPVFMVQEYRALR